MVAARIPLCSPQQQATGLSIPVLLCLHQLPLLCYRLLRPLLQLKVACSNDFRLKPVLTSFINAPFHSSSRICSFIPLFNPLTAVLRPSSAGSRPWGLRAGSPLVRTLQVCVIMPSVARSCICLIFCFPLSGRRIFCNIRFSSHRNGSHPRKGSLAGSAIVNVTFCTRSIVKYKRPLYHPAMPGFRF